MRAKNEREKEREISPMKSHTYQHDAVQITLAKATIVDKQSDTVLAAHVEGARLLIVTSELFHVAVSNGVNLQKRGMVKSSDPIPGRN